MKSFYFYNMRLFYKIIFLIIIISITGGFYAVSFISQIREVERKFEVKINNQIIIADSAISFPERKKGLASRIFLGINEGMMFLFDEPGYHGIWMKGMRIPIDIVWIGPNKEIVSIEEYVFPPREDIPDNELTVYLPSRPASYVLELKAGRVSILEAKEGDIVEINPLIKKRE